MDRRRFLASLGVGTSVGLAGCFGTGPSNASRAEDREARTANGGEREGTNPASTGESPTPAICERELRYDPGIYAIVDPVFGDDWDGVNVDPLYTVSGASELTDGMTIVGIDDGEVARAYPLSVLSLHEIVNDTVRGGPVAVTYCPLCRSGLVFERVVDDTATTFAVSGLLWEPDEYEQRGGRTEGVFGAEVTGGERRPVASEGNLVMYDEATLSYWSQILARAICGPKAGTDLDVVPSSVATWGDWREAHPDGEVLLPPPASKTTLPAGPD